MFIGRKGAKRLSQSRQGDEAYRMLKMAKKKERLGLSPHTIKKDFGWERGADGFWRYEINESEEIKRPELEKILQGECPLDEVLHYPRLFRAYPELHQFRIRVWDNTDRDRMDYKIQKIFLSENKVLDELEAWDRDPVRKEHECRWYILHEVQHIIQFMEGFTRGGSVEETMLYQNPPLLRIKAYCPQLYVYYISVVICNDIQMLKKGGLHEMLPNVDRYEKNCGHTWFGRIVTDSMRFIVDHCQPEAYEQLLDIYEVIKKTTNPDWRSECIEQYRRFAGEVEARNAAHAKSIPRAVLS